jgi:copper transport protein
MPRSPAPAVVSNGRTLAIGARMALATLLAAAAGLLAPAFAFAHADLASSVPMADSTVARAPQRIVLRFTEQPDPRLSKASLLNAAGRPVPGASPLEAVPGHPLSLQIVLSRPLPKGVYTVDWFSVSAVDGHTVPGAFAFGVGLPPGAGKLAPNPFSTSPWASAAAATGRWLLYIGLLALVGGASTSLLVFGGRIPAGGVRVLWGALLLAAIADAVLIAAERALTHAPSLSALLGTPEGGWLVRLGVALGVCALSVGFVTLRPSRAALLAVGATGSLAVLVHVLSGHADAPSSVRLGNVVLQWVHVTAAGVWVGGLGWLLLGTRGRGRQERASAASAFSRVATVMLVVVLLTGLARALVEVGSVRALFSTSFGVTLLVKLALVAALVALGALNHYRWVPAAAESEAGARALLRNSRGELIVAAAVLAATAVLSGLAPANAALAARLTSTAPGVTLSGSDSGATMRVRLNVEPAAVGPNTYSVQVADYATGAPLAAVSAVQLAFFYLPRPAIGSSTLDLKRQTGGTWRGAGFQLSLAGRWAIFVIVQRGINSVEARLQLDVGPPAR